MKITIECININAGDCFYIKNDKRKYHIVSVLDEPNKQVVYKYFGIYKKRWHYDVISLASLSNCFNMGYYAFTRK